MRRVEPKYKFVLAALAHAPDSSGVYGLWQQDELIYLGRAFGAATIRSQLHDHLRGRGAAHGEATHCTWEPTRYPATRELELLDEFLGRFGRLPRYNRGA